MSWTLHEGALHVVPVCHERMEFAHEVRRAILSTRPKMVAIELHDEVREAYLQAVERLPLLTWIKQWNAVPAGTPEDAELAGGVPALYLTVEPTDPFVEAVRTATEAGIPVHFIDLNVEAYPSVYDPHPDSYSLYHISLEQYYRAYTEATALPQLSASELEAVVEGEAKRAGASDDEVGAALRLLSSAASADAVRERHMAWRLTELMRGGDVLLVCGMAHAAPIMRHVREGTGRRGKAAAVKEVRLLNPDPQVVRASSSEMPFLMAAYEFDRKGAGPEEIWAAKPEVVVAQEPTPLESLTADDVMGALQSLLGQRKPTPDPRIELTPELLRAISRKLRVRHDPQTLLGLLLGIDPKHIPRLPTAPTAEPGSHRIFKFRNVDDRRAQLREIYTDASRLRKPATGMLDRQRVLIRMLNIAARFYEENTGEKFKRWQLRTLLQFIRSWARLRGMLLPRRWWDWTVAARGVADDNYAYEVWDLASFYPWTEEGGALGQLDLDGLDSMMREMRFRRRWPRFRERFMKAPVRPRKQEQGSEDWASDFDGSSICSYPPEDIVIEDYGRYLKKKGLLVLSEERTRTEPFSTSLLDGIDVRETIRNWPRTEGQGGRIYVREAQKISGGAGSVVVIFDEDVNDERYPWKMTWLGENQQESDMAFFATPIHAKIVGPGIARCEYGGFMLTYPPRRVMDVWSDPFYGEAQTKSEVLLWAGLEYSQEKHVIYVASKPPRSLFRTLANRVGKKIVYLPIGQLSPVSIKKLRVFHVLSGHNVREFAKDYIW